MNNKFSKSELVLGQFDSKIVKKPEYIKLLNNLLGISSRDNSTFSSSKTNNFDLEKLLSENDYQKVFTNHTFKVQITNVKDDETIFMLSRTNNIDEFIDIADTNAISVSITDRKLLEKSFGENKAQIIIKLRKQKNQFIAKWKKIRNKYLDLQMQTNSWPLYVGSMFIKVATSKAKLYAPLIMKKVEIEITNTNRVYIKSIDKSLNINEKLLFLLQDAYKFNLPKLNEEEDFSLAEVSDEFKNALNKIVNEDFSMLGKFEFHTKNEINNQDMRYATGQILTLSSPGGGELRNKMLEILKENNLDEILDVDLLKNIKQKVANKLESQMKIFRITKTDLSQEKAIVGSLLDSSIIWGPPGTGKSQTISNIIANLLALDKQTLVTSEKKAALDVIKERMGPLQKYIFFGLVDKNVNKEEFYRPFQNLMKVIIIEEQVLQNFDGKSAISNNQLSYLKQAKALADENTQALVSIDYHNNNEYLKFIMKHDKIIKKSTFINYLSQGEPVQSATDKAKIQKQGFWIFKRYPNDFKIGQKLINKFKLAPNAISDYKKIKNNLLITQLHNMLNVEKKYLENKHEFINDTKYLDMLLATKFKERLNSLLIDPILMKKTKTFMKNCRSGFRVPYKFVDIYKDIINRLFNVFVSTPNTLAGTINMNQKYDYAIFDEASQLHIEKAIPFIYMADKSIIAGDNQQMRPTNFFAIRDNNISNEDNEENVDSLLDYAYRKGLNGSREYMLNKNYRSAKSELMIFSSKEFYNSELDTIDNFKMNEDEAIEVFNVNGEWIGRVNEKEALATLNKTIESVNSFESIIILTLNSTQKQYIEALIYQNQKYEPIIEGLKDGNVKLRNLENIQGDEADLVIVSVAYDKKARLSSTYIARPEGRNALNVAISRAKVKMIVFKSILHSEFLGSNKNKSITTFRNWLQYLELNAQERKNNYISVETHKKSEHFDSQFEEEVFDYITRNLKLLKDTYLTTQYGVGSYLIDLAIIDSRTNQFILGIEVDGYRYHSGFEKMTKDIERQSFLETKGYPIYRITELNWHARKEHELSNISTIIMR